MDAVAAVYSDWGLGDGATQPVVLSADRRHFRCLTEGSAVICGRKTLEDFPGGKPLPGRVNIVLTRQDTPIEGAQVVHSVQEALDLAAQYDRCLVIGGESVFNAFLPYLDYIFLTKIDTCPESRSFFPDLDRDSRWSRTFESDRFEENGISYSFCTYKKGTSDV